MIKRIHSLILLTILCLSLAGCADSGKNPPQPVPEAAPSTAQTWSIYWYLCGSDLESWYGCATADLEEMLAVKLPENVQVIIQTGGAMQWSRDDILPQEIGRYIYDSSGLRKLESKPQANMGETETLSDFLSFCKENYPADRTMVLFWNHGGGSVTGAEFDSNYYFDSLTLNEFNAAFSQVYSPDSEHPPIDVIGFDACLMATVDVAGTFRDMGHYLVASEELEPGNGWYYTGWLQALADNPAMSASQLGIEICDAYRQGCELAGTGDDITLSVTDLSKIGPLLEAYNDLGTEALVEAIDNPDFYTTFSRGAIGAESYGGNTKEQGYTNMVDLGHLARNNEHLLPDSTREVLLALEDCIVYRINGPYRSESSGLSCYHSYNGDLNNFVDYTGVGCSEAFKYLYGYGLSGKVSDAGREYVRSVNMEAVIPEQIELFDISVLENAEITVDDEGWADLYVGEQAAASIASVQSLLVWFVDGKMINLGWSDTSCDDFTQGLFYDYVDGYWPSIDGHLVHTEVVCQEEDYTIYSVPVLLNGEQYNLRVVYDEIEQYYTVLGARKGLTDDGMPDKNLIQLKLGDELTFVYLERALEESGGFGYTTGENIVVDESTMFYETPLPSGEYGLMFKMFDARNNSALSEVLRFDMDDDYIYFY